MTDLDAKTYREARRAMVDGQVRPSDVTRRELIDAMLETPREAFVPPRRRAQAYMGEHLDLGDGRVELDPRVFAKMAQALEPQDSDLALVVGSAGGYAAAILSKLTTAVVALEPNETLSRLAAAAFEAGGLATVIAQQGAMADGCPAHAPYNIVLVNGAIEREAPAAWTDQLAEGGRLVVINAAHGAGRCEIWLKSGGVVGTRPAFDASAPALPGFERAEAFDF